MPWPNHVIVSSPPPPQVGLDASVEIDLDDTDELPGRGLDELAVEMDPDLDDSEVVDLDGGAPPPTSAAATGTPDTSDTAANTTDASTLSMIDMVDMTEAMFSAVSSTDDLATPPLSPARSIESPGGTDKTAPAQSRLTRARLEHDENASARQLERAATSTLFYHFNLWPLFSSTTHTRRVTCSTWRPCLFDACLMLV